MKRIIYFTLACLACVSCYEPYVKDYDYCAVYSAYQYDLRSFVVGEGMQFKFTAALGGLLANDRDRKVDYEIDDALVTGDLRSYFPDATESVTAFEAMTTGTSWGTVSQDYVNSSMKSSGITAMTPLPSSAYSLSDENITIKKGNMTGTVTVSADSLGFLSLPGASSKPYYALGFKIRNADADTVLLGKSFQVCAVRYEHMFFGYWYHGGRTEVYDADGKLIRTREYYTTIPCDETTQAVYKLTTDSPNSVVTNYMGDIESSVRLSYNGGYVKVTSNDYRRKVTDVESTFNKVSLLQDRKIFLKYRYTDLDGTTCLVTDTLTFRNRIRDGVNEWQDTNINHYK